MQEYNVQEVITLGSQVCAKLRTIYFSNEKWVVCYRSVADLFGNLKHEARKFYPDKNEVELLQELTKYSTNDITDALENVPRGT